ncbi:hypothetical protein [Streptomyces sp. NPDC001948]
MGDGDGALGSRIWIVGPPGSGKSTLARALHRRSALPLHELDQLFWQPGWRKTDEREFQAAVARIAEEDGWIIEGQYPSVHPVLAAAADTLIQLDIRSRTAFIRMVRRSVRHMLHRHVLCNGNREGPLKAVGFWWWALRSYSGIRQQNEALLNRLSPHGTRCICVRTSAEWDRLLAESDTRPGTNRTTSRPMTERKGIV